MRGTALDSIFLVVTIFVITMSLAFSLYSVGQINDAIETELTAIGAPAESLALFSDVDEAKTAFGNTFLVLVFGLMAATLVFSYMVRHNRLFLVFAFLILIVALIVAVILKTAWDAAVNALPALALQIPRATWFFSHLTEIIMVWGILNLLAMYKGATAPEGM